MIGEDMLGPRIIRSRMLSNVAPQARQCNEPNIIRMDSCRTVFLRTDKFPSDSGIRLMPLSLHRERPSGTVDVIYCLTNPIRSCHF